MRAWPIKWIYLLNKALSLMLDEGHGLTSREPGHPLGAEVDRIGVGILRSSRRVRARLSRAGTVASPSMCFVLTDSQLRIASSACPCSADKAAPKAVRGSLALSVASHDAA
jgi:hypothetical protein